MDSRDHARRPRRIVVPGPLAPFADGLRQDLAGQGYALDTVTDHVHLLADLSGGLAGRGLAAADLTGEAAGEFLGGRRAAGHRSGVTVQALAPVLGYLRSVQAVPAPERPVPATPLEELLAVYRQYLEGERGRRPARSGITCGMRGRCCPGSPDRSPRPCRSCRPGRSPAMCWSRPGAGREGAPDMVRLPALRSVLRYLHAAGHIPLPLDMAVPEGRAWRPGLPRAVPADHLRAVLAGCDRDSAPGRRDYAIVLAMARLAVRGGEVAGLRLADVGWRSGELTIHGKGGRTDILPLPAHAGEAMADYLLHARPASTSPQLFVTVKAPFTALAVSSVTQVVARACARAGVPRFGPHRIRHAAACGLLSAGASMEEIGQLLRHAQQRTTAIYAKVDQARLAELAVPCPQGAAR